MRQESETNMRLGEDLLLHDTLRESGAASALITGVLALNGYLAVRNFAFTFSGKAVPRYEALRKMRPCW